MLDNTEARRLATLHSLRVLDSEPNAAIDAIAESAAALCDVPIALVTLVDQNRQWFKANSGLPGTSETARSIAFCDHAIRDEDVLIVNDALLDERFRDNPLVTHEPRLRFYAGAPLVAENGDRLGALCVLDRQPRTLDSNQIAALSALAATAVKLLAREAERDGHESLNTPGPSMQDDKVSMILQSAKSVLVRQGAAGFSIRKVAEAAGISLGHVQHYFPTKGALLRAMAESLEHSFHRFFKHELEPVPNPLDRLVACAEVILDRGPDERMVPLLLEFRGIAMQDTGAAESLSGLHAECQRYVKSMLQEANPGHDATEIEHRALAIIALVSGALLSASLRNADTEPDDHVFKQQLLSNVVRFAICA
jgi:AcrR family transcriptional regulator